MLEILNYIEIAALKGIQYNLNFDTDTGLSPK